MQKIAELLNMAVSEQEVEVQHESMEGTVFQRVVFVAQLPTVDNLENRSVSVIHKRL